MKKKLLNLTFIVVAGINAFMFYGFSDGGRDNNCGNQGREIDAWIRVELPQMFGSNYEKCAWGNDFSFNNLTYADVIPYTTNPPSGNDPYQLEQWYMIVQVFYGQGTNLYGEKYGQLPDAGFGGSGINKHSVIGCNFIGVIPIGDFSCSEFPIRLQTEHVNEIDVTIFAPCGYLDPNIQRRAVVSYKKSFNVNIGHQGNSLLIDGDYIETTSQDAVCNPCEIKEHENHTTLFSIVPTFPFFMQERSA